MGREASLPAGLPQTSPDVAEFLEKRRIPRDRATRKLRDVLTRLAEGDPPLDEVRTAWVHGSYARGAPDVGDVDLELQIDETRSPQQQQLDALYRRAHPYTEVLSALGCGAGSFVSVNVNPVFLDDESKIGRPVRRPRESPELVHVVTHQPFDPPPKLLWVRGESGEKSIRRLEKMPVDPKARRFERTTTVPLLDDLSHLVTTDTAFLLAAQLRAGNLAIEPLLLPPGPAPAPAREALEDRYQPRSPRAAPAAAALAYFVDRGLKVSEILLGKEPVVRHPRGPRAGIEFNLFTLYLLAAGNFERGWQHVHIWLRSSGPWLALHLTVTSNKRDARSVYGRLSDGLPEDRAKRFRDFLGLGKSSQAPASVSD